MSLDYGPSTSLCLLALALIVSFSVYLYYNIGPTTESRHECWRDSVFRNTITNHNTWYIFSQYIYLLVCKTFWLFLRVTLQSFKHPLTFFRVVRHAHSFEFRGFYSMHLVTFSSQVQICSIGGMKVLPLAKCFRETWNKNPINRPALLLSFELGVFTIIRETFSLIYLCFYVRSGKGLSIGEQHMAVSSASCCNSLPCSTPQN